MPEQDSHATQAHPWLASGLLKPSFGWSGVVLLQDKASLRLVRAFLRSTRTRSRLDLRTPSRTDGNCSTPSLPEVHSVRVSLDSCGLTEFFENLSVVTNVEMVVPFLPEMLGALPTQAKRRLEWATRPMVVRCWRKAVSGW